jgi:hypothetical protein
MDTPVLLFTSSNCDQRSASLSGRLNSLETILESPVYVEGRVGHRTGVDAAERK